MKLLGKTVYPHNNMNAETFFVMSRWFEAAPELSLFLLVPLFGCISSVLYSITLSYVQRTCAAGSKTTEFRYSLIMTFVTLFLVVATLFALLNGLIAIHNMIGTNRFMGYIIVLLIGMYFMWLAANKLIEGLRGQPTE